MLILEEANRKIKPSEHEELINVELFHISQQRFTAFIAACKKNGDSAHEVIAGFLDDYTRKIFGNDINYSEICKDHEDRIEEY